MSDFLDFDIEVVESDTKKGIFKIGPLARGYGHTLANSLRRVLLSSLEGAGITSIKISGVDHEYSTVKGVKETVIEIMLNLKAVRFKLNTNEPQTVKLSAKGAGEATAKDLDLTESVEVMNPDAKIATLTDKSSKLEIEMVVEKGLGYKVGNEDVRSEVGRLPMDANFSPVERVTFSIDETRKGENTNLDLITMTILTDGAVTPNEALSHSAKMLRDIFERFITLLNVEPVASVAAAAAPVAEGDVNAMPVENLDISKRAKTALVGAGVATVGDLLGKTEADLSAIAGVGDKAIKDIKKFLKKYDLELKA